MINHPLQYNEKLDKKSLEAIIDGSLEILRTKGLVIQSEECCRILGEAGAEVSLKDRIVRFTPELVFKNISRIQPEWTLYARNVERNLRIGGRNLVVAPGYGSAFVADIEGRRRSAKMSDFENLAYMSYVSNVIDITGGLLVEPNNISPALRPLEITLALIRNSDKPFLGSVAGKEGARESIEMTKIVFGDIEEKPCIVGLININSPLRLDSQMAEALVTYCQAGQAILLTPGIMMGVNAPVTVAGAICQAFAELLGCATLAQIIRPGCPLIIGLGGVGSDLRNVSTGFGRPENALAIEIGAQVTRHLRIPFRCSAAVTGARRPDCRSGYERMLTAITAYNSGAHFCLQAAGILDSINMMSYEQYVIDIEIWSYIKRFSEPVVVDKETIGLDVVDHKPENYITSGHTVKHMREALFIPALTNPDNYEVWWSSNAKDVVFQAAERVQKVLNNIQPPRLDEDIEKELAKYVSQRRKILERVS